MEKKETSKIKHRDDTSVRNIPDLLRQIFLIFHLIRNILTIPENILFA